jgi:hypothetical protein
MEEVTNLKLSSQNSKMNDLIKTYLLGFILAEYGLDEMFSSIGLLTEGIGMFEIPLSYSLFLRSFLFEGSAT